MQPEAFGASGAVGYRHPLLIPYNLLSCARSFSPVDMTQPMP